MFVNSTHLPQRLDPEDYVSDEVYQRELATLFLPGWHCVATMPEIPRVGDFRSLDQSRREAITTSERLKARRNELSQQVGALKKAGQDASAVMDETRALKDRLGLP